VGRVREGHDLEGHALAGSSVKHPLHGRMLEGGRHGAEDSIGRNGTIVAMDAIVFDWDGTLYNSLPAIYDANRTVLAEYGLPFDDERYRSAYVPDWRLMYQRLGIPEEHLDAAGLRWLSLYRATAEAGLLPRVKDSLERLTAAGFVLGLVTAGHRDVVEGQLDRFGLGRLIPVRVYGSDAIAAKPHPEPLLRVLAQLNRSERVATARYVGDVPDDMRMARAAGALGIGIEGTIASRDELVAAGATVVYGSVASFVDELLDGASRDPREHAAGEGTASASGPEPPGSAAAADAS
jgi:HAD superfamily hydrolase (TIGR01549 family)